MLVVEVELDLVVKVVVEDDEVDGEDGDEALDR